MVAERKVTEEVVARYERVNGITTMKKQTTPTRRLDETSDHGHEIKAIE